MQARDVMTTSVVTVDPETTVTEIARALLANNIAAVPVVDKDGAVAGIVSEANLLRRPETGTVKRRSWLAFFDDPETSAAEYVHTHGARAKDVMTAEVYSVAPDAELSTVVTMMEKRHIRRVLVMEADKLTGIVCRSDLLRGLLASREAAAASDSDRAIRAMLLEELHGQYWPTIAGNKITVSDGVVSFWGTVASDKERTALRVAAESIPGVKRVDDNTAVRAEIPYGWY